MGRSEKALRAVKFLSPPEVPRVCLEAWSSSPIFNNAVHCVEVSRIDLALCGHYSIKRRLKISRILFCDLLHNSLTHGRVHYSKKNFTCELSYRTYYTASMGQLHVLATWMHNYYRATARTSNLDVRRMWESARHGETRGDGRRTRCGRGRKSNARNFTC